MASRTDGEGVPVFGQFHQECGEGVVLSEGKRVASGCTSSYFGPLPIAFSNDPFQRGFSFLSRFYRKAKEM